MIIFESLLTPLEALSYFKAAGAVSKIGLSKFSVKVCVC